MSRSDANRLEDIATAITSIRSHLQLGPISVEIVIDAVAMRLLEIGEAVKGNATPEGLDSRERRPLWVKSGRSLGRNGSIAVRSGQMGTTCPERMRVLVPHSQSAPPGVRS